MLPPVGSYRARDLLTAPSLISWLRVPLALAFVLSIEQRGLAFLVLLLSGFTDVLDGWWARRAGSATATGAVLDGVTDKLFALVVMATLIAEGRLPLWSALALSARELGEAPLVLWWALSHHRRRAKAEEPRANLPGKMATGLQYGAISLALAASPWVEGAVLLAGAAGVIAAVIYWRRELAAAGENRPPA